ncbi:hypothetical protein ABIB14_003371 [Arthrobacter sp. UYEF3]
MTDYSRSHYSIRRPVPWGTRPPDRVFVRDMPVGRAGLGHAPCCRAARGDMPIVAEQPEGTCPLLPSGPRGHAQPKIPAVDILELCPEVQGRGEHAHCSQPYVPGSMSSAKRREWTCSEYVQWSARGEGMSDFARQRRADAIRTGVSVAAWPRAAGDVVRAAAQVAVDRRPSHLWACSGPWADQGTCPVLAWDSGHIGTMPRGQRQGRACPLFAAIHAREYVQCEASGVDMFGVCPMVGGKEGMPGGPLRRRREE